MRIVGWGNMSGEDVCVKCGALASLIVETDDDFEPQPMCSSCVPLKTPDGIRDAFMSAMDRRIA